jgi:hypothetical protein
MSTTITVVRPFFFEGRALEKDEILTVGDGLAVELVTYGKAVIQSQEPAEEARQEPESSAPRRRGRPRKNEETS